jgi:predicted HTH transcriptional regulator
MAHYLDQLLDEPESEPFEKKSSLDPSNAKEMLGLVADVVAMSNANGGRLLIGTRAPPSLTTTQSSLIAHASMIRSTPLSNRT